MQDLFRFCNITRQAHHQALIREQKWADIEYLIVGLILQTREVHPGMGLRVIYDILKPNGLGRDAFISIGFAYGFRLITFKNPIKTTFSSPYSRYKNLLVDKKLNDINQLWTSDITYYNLAGIFYYIVLIMDVYSRKIIGYSVDDNMRADNNCQALEMAFKTRKQHQFTNLIHHSDRGGQYVSDDYTNMLIKAGIKISMCNEVHENAHIERVNGTIKNQYLRYWNITRFEELEDRLKLTIDAYNNSRPHSSLLKMTPDSFEQYIKELEVEKRPKLPIWTTNEIKNINPNQCIIQF
jgi:putative transposase